MAKNTTTRWDALSMRDRASLIKLYSQSGIRKLDDMRAHYNKFGDGGDEDKLWYNPEFDSDHGVMIDEAVVEAKASEKKKKKSKQDKYNDEVAAATLAELDKKGVNRHSVLGTPVEKPLENEDYLLGAAAIGLTAPVSGTIAAAKEAAPLWGKAGLRMLRDIPAFEFVDRLPTVFGGKRMTEFGGDATQYVAEKIAGRLLSQTGTMLARLPGEFAFGVVPGVAGDMLMRTGVNTGLRVANAVDNAFRFNASELGSVDPRLANDVFYTEPFLGHPGAPSEVIANESLSLPVSIANATMQSANPYVIEDLGGGYMLPSLMRGNPLEKQIGKNGTVNVNNIKALMKNWRKVDAAVVDKVLASEEFAGKKSIDYNKFRKAVQDELITYDRKPDTRWATYGMDRLGLGIDWTNPDVWIPQREVALSRLIHEHNLPWYINEDGLVFERGTGRPIANRDIDEQFTNWIERYGHPNAQADTYTFSSPRIPEGSAKHYDKSTLGHSRTYTTADEPDVLHVMESQSDWAQGNNAYHRKQRDLEIAHDVSRIQDKEDFIKSLEEDIEAFRNEIEKHKNLLKSGRWDDGEKLGVYDVDRSREAIAYFESQIPIKEEKLAIARDFVKHAKKAEYEALTEDYLTDNYTSRQIQENLRYAAEKGQTKMRYPTRETAAKIEKYPTKTVYVDNTGKEAKIYYEYNDETLSTVDNLKKELSSEIEKIRNNEVGSIGWVPPYGLGAPIFVTPEQRSGLIKYMQKIDELLKPENNIKPGLTKKQVYEYENILKKYTEFPKQYQKLFKGADVRTVTDPKGNTWYEVDVPENYLQKEWQYANGGSIHINPKNRGKFNALLKRTGKSASWFKEHGTPLQRKRATFALNARKWKHPDGGEINVLGNPSYNKAQEDYMYRYLKDSGMDDTHVAAIMGNISVESLLNAEQKQIKGPAWGLIQAEGSRQEAIKNYNDVPYLFGSKLSPEEQRQLDYIIEKGIRIYTPGEWGIAGFKGARQARNGFINETDLTKATDIFMRNYERPSKQHRSWRQNMSKYYYDKYKEPEYYVPLDFFNK